MQNQLISLSEDNNWLSRGRKLSNEVLKRPLENVSYDHYCEELLAFPPM